MNKGIEEMRDRLDKSIMEDVMSCGGTGVAEYGYNSITGAYWQRVCEGCPHCQCPECKGEGHTWHGRDGGNTCYTCKGTGRKVSDGTQLGRA